MDMLGGGTSDTAAATAAADRKFSWMKPYIERIVIMMKSNDTQQWLQVFLIDPILSYIMNRFFAYFIIALICFGALLLFVILTFVVLVLRTKSAHICPSCGS